MTRVLTTAGALVLATAMVAGIASAASLYGQTAQNTQMAAAPAATGQVRHHQAVGWHYAWRYHFDKWGQYVPGWVPVLNKR
jgi:hypothetical protein